jgi:hypothetical protein
VGNVSSFMGDHHSLLQLIMNLKHKRIQHIFDQIFQAFMVFIKVSSKTGFNSGGLFKGICPDISGIQCFLKTILVPGLPSQEFSYLFPNRLYIRADLCFLFGHIRTYNTAWLSPSWDDIT